MYGLAAAFAGPRRGRRLALLFGAPFAAIVIAVASVVLVDAQHWGAREALGEVQALSALNTGLRSYAQHSEPATATPTTWLAAQPALNAERARLQQLASAAHLPTEPQADAAFQRLLAADARLTAEASSGLTPAWAAAVADLDGAGMAARDAVAAHNERQLDVTAGTLARADQLARYTDAGTTALLLAFTAALVLLDRGASRRQLGIVRSSEQRLQDVLDQSPAAVYLTGLDDRYVLVNRAWEAATGRPRQEVLGRRADEVWPPAEAAAGIARRRQVASSGVTAEALIPGPADQDRQFLESTFALTDPDGKTYLVGGIATDVSERLRAKEQERLLAAVVASSDDAILTAHDGVITSCNPAAQAMLTGTQPAVGRRLTDLFTPGSVAPLQKALRSARDEPVRGREMVLVATTGLELTVAVTATPLDGQDAHTLSVVLHDVGQAQRHRAELMQQARVDVLTGLANRLAFQERLSARRGEATPGCLLFVDLDHFKLVNDTFGHGTGDQLLREVAQRLSTAVGPDAFVARLGGDEFAVLDEGCDSDDAALQLAERIRGQLGDPVKTDDSDVLSVTASVGVCVGPAESVDAWIRDADVAMYAAKRAGRNRSVLFTAEEGAASLRQQHLRHDLQAALADEKFVVHYQPVIDLRTGRPVGAEALVRWQHPERGLLSPDAFIPLAEDSGHIAELGRQVWRMAVRDLLDWGDAGAGLHLAVNVSVRQLQDQQFLDLVEEDLTRWPQLRGRLMLELTESALAEGTLLPSLEGLRRAGVTLAIDDFGTGYSALSYLSQFPVDCLKIDKSFLDGLAHSRDAYSVLRTVLELAGTLGLTTIAEGIEDEQTAALVASAGCDSAQGYWWSAPVPRAQLQETLHRLSQTPRAAPTAPPAPRPATRRRPVEPDVVARAVQLHTAGASTHTIAAMLNKEGIRTPSGRRWHAASIGAVLDPSPAQGPKKPPPPVKRTG